MWVNSILIGGVNANMIGRQDVNASQIIKRSNKTPQIDTIDPILARRLNPI